MILGHVHMVHYSPVNIDESDASWQMELDPVTYWSAVKKTGKRNRKVLTR
jgi:hypothetical protein